MNQKINSAGNPSEAQRDAVPQWVAGAFDVFREKYDKQRCKKLGVSDWKDALRLLWYRGADDQEGNGGILRSIRNHPEGLGYRWLDEYALNSPDVAATKLSGAQSTQDARISDARKTVDDSALHIKIAEAGGFTVVALTNGKFRWELKDWGLTKGEPNTGDSSYPLEFETVASAWEAAAQEACGPEVLGNRIALMSGIV